jgi:hypothetical protein
LRGSRNAAQQNRPRTQAGQGFRRAR